jgi:DNA-binding transcriptional LysR family regulator
MNHLDPRWLQSFDAIAQTGGLARAAGRVHRTPSAVSMQLRQLETAVGVRLVERTTRSVRLSVEGQRFLPYARRLLELQEEAQRSLRATASPAVWRVGVSEYFMPQRLGELLAVLEHRAEGDRLELLMASSSQLMRLWEAQAVDTVIVTSAEPVAQARLVRREPLAWVASAKNAAQQPRDVPLVMLGTDCPVRAMALGALARAGVSYRLRLTCSGSQAAVAAIRGGWGIGCLNASAVPPDLSVLGANRARRWPAPGRLGFYLLSRPDFADAAKGLAQWAAA